MLKLRYLSLLAGLAFVLSSGPVTAAVTAQEAAQLKTTLTPFGAEKSGNEDGSIPAWTGGYTTVPEGYKSGDKRHDPFAAEKPLFSITGENVDKYADSLSEGEKFLLKKYPDFRMDVYPTHRTAAAPQWVYENTLKNATRDGLSITGALGGIPFPFPSSGREAMWNHLLYWQGKAYKDDLRIYLMTPEGKAVLLSEATNYMQFPYYYQDEKDFNGYSIYISQLQTAPPIKNGESILVRDPLDQYGEGRKAWQYLSGQRRVRRAPAIAYDTPDSVSSGQQYYDEIWMFVGALDRYDWKIVGKKEMYVPYNCNSFYQTTDRDAIGEGMHSFNPNRVRWEKHRVWVVEATLAQGKRHVVSKKRFYLDEDTWQALLSDGWDANGQLWRHAVGIPLLAFDLPGQVLGTFGIYNLQTGTRTATNVFNESKSQHEFIKPKPESYFTPEALAGRGVR